MLPYVILEESKYKLFHRQSCFLQTKTVLFSSLPNLYTFYFLFPTYSLARTSSKMLKRSCHARCCEKNFKCLTIKYDVRYRFFVCSLSWLRKFSLFLVYSEFLWWISIGFCQKLFFSIYWQDHETSFSLWMWWITLTDFQMLNHCIWNCI